MTTTLGQGNGSNRHIVMLATAAAFLAAVMFATAAPAHAKEHGHQNHGHHDNGNHNNGHQGYSHGPRRVQSVPYYAVPQVLTSDYRGTFQPYYHGRSYYAPHHHYHASYRLPVYYNGAVVYRPYAYCGDRLFVTGAVALPQLALSFNFGAPGGFYVGGSYPAPLPPPAPYYIYEDPYWGHDHDGRCD